MNPNQRVIEFMAKLTKDEESIVSHARDLALGVSDGVREDLKWNALCFFKGDRAFAGIQRYKNYVSVIFDRGAELEDPGGLLEGKGKMMRHIKIRNPNELKEKRLGSYIKQSFLLE